MTASDLTVTDPPAIGSFFIVDIPPRYVLTPVREGDLLEVIPGQGRNRTKQGRVAFFCYQANKDYASVRLSLAFDSLLRVARPIGRKAAVLILTLWGKEPVGGGGSDGT